VPIFCRHTTVEGFYYESHFPFAGMNCAVVEDRGASSKGHPSGPHSRRPGRNFGVDVTFLVY